MFNIIMLKSMFNFIKRMGAGARVAFCSTMLALTAGAGSAFAQVDGAELLNAGTSAGQQLLTALVRFLQIGLGLAALVTLVMTIYNVFKQEREAATKLIWWVVGLAIGFGLLTALANQLNNV